MIEIDEGSRYRYDCVRLRIACRDVSNVPKTAEGTLGMYIIDFGFEREMPEESGEKVLKSGIIVSDERPAKKSKADVVADRQLQVDKGGEEDSSKSRQVSGKDTGKQTQQVYWSAPPKIDFKRKSETKLMEKSYNDTSPDDDEGKVHIPDSFEDSETDSDSFTLKISKLTGMGDTGQSSSKGAHEDSTKQLWFVDTGLDDSMLHKSNNEAMATILANKATGVDGVSTAENKEKNTTANGQSPEIFIPDDNIINTQESVRMEVECQEKDTVMEDNIHKDTLVGGTKMEMKAQHIQERRRSERLKDSSLTTMEKLKRVAKKRIWKVTHPNPTPFLFLLLMKL